MCSHQVNDTETAYICALCIGDKFLREEINERGNASLCFYCDAITNGISLQDLSDRIHEIIERKFYQDIMPDSGELILDVIAEIACVEEKIAEHIRQYLSDLHGFSAAEEGQDDPYAKDACYREREPDDLNFRDMWESFCQQIRWRSRFFSKYAEIDLDNIFGDLENSKAVNGKPVIEKISAEDNGFIYRARVAFSNAELLTILENPVREIGAPAPKFAKAGRMNPAGISVFYGAQDIDTCLAEVRAPVGSSVVIGRFSIIRPVKLLNLDALSEIHTEGSYFDSEFLTQKDRSVFLRRLVQVISRPIMPHEELFEYLPTQVIAEYLASKAKPNLDGIIFGSSQTGGEGKNVVLFNHASKTESRNLPDGTKVNIFMDEGIEDVYDTTISVFERVSAPDPQQNIKEDDEEGRWFQEMLSYQIDDEVWLDKYEPTLRLDISAINVYEINGVKYSCLVRPVMRYKIEGKKA